MVLKGCKTPVPTAAATEVNCCSIAPAPVLGCKNDDVHGRNQDLKPFLTVSTLSTVAAIGV